MNSFAIYTTKYKDKEYDFVPTRKARIAIEELSLSAFDGISDPQVLAIAMGGQNSTKELQNVKNMLQKAKDEENQELIEHYTLLVEQENDKINKQYAELIPRMKDLTKAQSKAEDQYEIAKLLLLNYSGNGEINGALADDVLENMEMELGSDKFEDKLLDITDKVFTQMRRIQDRKTEIFKKQEKEAEAEKTKPILMS